MVKHKQSQGRLLALLRDKTLVSFAGVSAKDALPPAGFRLSATLAMSNNKTKQKIDVRLNKRVLRGMGYIGRKMFPIYLSCKQDCSNKTTVIKYYGVIISGR